MSNRGRGFPPILASLTVIAGGVSLAAALHAQVPAGRSLPLLSVGTLVPRLLDTHNRERARVRLGPLVWDPVLAQGAAGHAQLLAMSGTFGHSDRRARRGIGENLWMGPTRAFAIEQMVGAWASERRSFRPGYFPAVSRDGNWMSVAHYTQIIWPATTRVGCAIASARGRDILVCRYAPAGNVDGLRVP